jgi:hypothetical protein
MRAGQASTLQFYNQCFVGKLDPPDTPSLWPLQESDFSPVGGPLPICRFYTVVFFGPH